MGFCVTFVSFSETIISGLETQEIRWNLGEPGPDSRNFGKTHSVEFSMALDMNSVGIPGGFGATAGFQKVWSLGWFRAIWGLKRLLRK